MFYDIEQGSIEWHELRLRRITSTRSKSCYSKPTTKSYKKTLYALLYEYAAKEKANDIFFDSFAMQRGRGLEPEAVKAYELKNLIPTTNGGFWTIGDWVGDSPDRMYDGGVLEIKCPLATTMDKYKAKPQLLVKQYEKQLKHHQWVTGASEVTIFAYHPEYSPIQITQSFELDNHIQKVNNFIEEVNKRL